jgi:hypothetical protein
MRLTSCPCPQQVRRPRKGLLAPISVASHVLTQRRAFNSTGVTAGLLAEFQTLT